MNFIKSPPGEFDQLTFDVVMHSSTTTPLTENFLSNFKNI